MKLFIYFFFNIIFVCVQENVLAQMVTPRIAIQEVGAYMWQHCARDVQVLQKVLGRSADDIYLLLHHLCHTMATIHHTGKHHDLCYLY